MIFLGAGMHFRNENQWKIELDRFVGDPGCSWAALGWLLGGLYATFGPSRAALGRFRAPGKGRTPKPPPPSDLVLFFCFLIFLKRNEGRNGLDGLKGLEGKKVTG